MDKMNPGIFFTIDTHERHGITKPLPYRTEDGKQAMRLYLKTNLAAQITKKTITKIADVTLDENGKMPSAPGSTRQKHCY